MFLMVAAGGCATKVIPPQHLTTPVTVFIADYGRHSTLMMPTTTGCLAEYGYGDWHFYALNKYRWYLGATALIYADASALGWRVFRYPQTEDEWHRYTWAKRLLKVQVEYTRVVALQAELDRRFNSHIETLVFNKHQGLSLVRDDSTYNLMHNCNGETAEWLEKLGCKIEGWPVLSNFEVAGQ